MDMRRLSEGKLPQESPMEARLREFKAQQADTTVPKAAGAQHQSMMEIPQSPIYGADGPQPKGSLPKQSASYSYNPTSGIGGSNSTINDTAELPGKLASPGGVNRGGSSYKSMALASYQGQKKKAVLERNLARRQDDSDSSDAASEQTDSEDEAFRKEVRAKGNASPKSTRSHQSGKSGASSARSKGGSSSNHTSNRSRSPKFTANAPARVMPGSPGGDSGDDSSSVGPTTSESEEEEMTAVEKMDMMSSHRSTNKEVLMIGDKKHRHKSKMQKAGKSIVNTSLYVAAKQPPWVEAALAEQAAQEQSESEYDSSEDERDRTREGKGGKDSEFTLTRGCYNTCGKCSRRLVSKPDLVERELPPDREWERAEKALSAGRSTIKKKWYNLWGRCTAKKLTQPVQLRLINFGLNITDSSSPAKQLAPQMIGMVLLVANVFYLAVGSDYTGRRLFGERNYMLFIFTAVCAYCIQFVCEHHRECHQGRLLVNFEGRTWQVLNAGVRDRLAIMGAKQQKYFRWVYGFVVLYYFIYLWWASLGLDMCNAAELEAGCIDGDGGGQTTLIDGTPKGSRWRFGLSRLLTMFYPVLLIVTVGFMCILESNLVIDRIEAFTNGLGSAQFVFSRPEAQAEHDLVVASVQAFSSRWATMLMVSAGGAVVSAGLLVSFFGEASWSPEGRMARRAPFEPTFLIFFAWALWLSVARINAAGKRLTSLAVGVSSSRIPLKGMLGRTSWCNYFMSMEICVTLGNGTAVDPVAAFQVVMVIWIPMMFFGFDPFTCEDGWYSCPGNEHLGRDADENAGGLLGTNG